MSDGLLKVHTLQTNPRPHLQPSPSQFMATPFFIRGLDFSHSPGNPVGSAFKLFPDPTTNPSPPALHPGIRLPFQIAAVG